MRKQIMIINLEMVTLKFEKYFLKLRKNKNNLLEIGVANGHSGASFYNFFTIQ